ncbi:hypothetical protein G7047_27020 [Diaphorobacter sp. HDW4A]|uniref:hypothetical protein n=1 Tax=Diaphorobacter sp. HDW4A TaxID=2714924 RepID=UPI00140A0244|nr:hypothetical protein [Diaphorobacter sp. HDW4A]QIL83182.1 hypothetical protein G7047_27020 [Diaphorobacter sp. HDW4A]
MWGPVSRDRSSYVRAGRSAGALWLIAQVLDFNPRVSCGRTGLRGVGVFLGPEVPKSLAVYRCSERDEAVPLLAR